MASFTKRGRKYIVRWYDPDGIQRTRTVPDYETARTLAREVERTVSLGRRWEPDDAAAVPVLYRREEDGRVTGAFGDFLRARTGRYDEDTLRHYDRALRRYLIWLAELYPRKRQFTVDLLTRDSIETWFGALLDGTAPALEQPRGRPPRGDPKPPKLNRNPPPLEVSSARLLVGAVLAAWEWAHDSDTYGDRVPRPRKVEMPAPVYAPAPAPSWVEMDRVIAAAHAFADSARTRLDRDAWTWRARACTVMRFTGLRIDEQVLQLRWDDVDLDQAELVVRGELGKSQAERSGRLLPLAPELVELMRGWGVREGWLVAPSKTDRHADPRHTAQLWRAAEVPERIWGVGIGRHKARVHHAFRAGFKTGLSRLGIASDVRDYLVGHHRGVDEHYLDTFEQARDAVQQLPRMTCDRTLITLPRKAEKPAL